MRTDSLENFVAIDIETTGLDPEGDEIIELGAARVRNGDIAERFERLVSPSKPIPPIITRLTGISFSDCAGQPSLPSVLPEFLHFMGDDACIVHNAPFDLSFLNRQLKLIGMKKLKKEVYDTLIISRILLPRLKNHQLPTLVQYFGIASPSVHRAGDDAEATARLFLALLEHVGQCDRDTLQNLIGFTPQATPLHRFFMQGVRTAPLKKIGDKRKDGEFVLDFVNVSGEGTRRRKKEPVTLHLGKITSTFRSKGELSTALPHYEKRPQQIQMVRAVALAFNNSEIVLAEAGTGVGKTMAYLVPSVQWAQLNGERVIISTKTKNLQEQLFYNDIPLLRKAMDSPFTSVLLKGRSNYLCLNRWYRTLLESNLREEERLEFLPLVPWIQETVSGDISENTGFRFHQNHGLWNKVCAESSYCLGQSCKYTDRCFYQKVRTAAQGAHIVVTNHALLFSDAIMDHKVLDTYSCLVLDEAHTVEKVAAQHFGCDFSIWRVHNLINRLHVREKVEMGLLVSLLRKIETVAMSKRLKEALTKRLKRAIERTDQVRAVSAQFFTHVTSEVLRGGGHNRTPYRTKLRYGVDVQLFVDDSSILLLKALKKLSDELVRIYDGLSELPEAAFVGQAESAQDMSGHATTCQEMVSDLSFLLRADDERYVYWVELHTQRDQYSAQLYASPLEIGQMMNTFFYQDLRTMIITSGTLTVDGRFDYMMERLGLDQERTVQFVTDSPFDFESQAFVCVPAFLSSPKERSFQGEIGQLMKEIVLATRRGTLALFTSYDMLTSTYDRVKDALGKERIPVFAQGLNGSRTRLMAQFKEERCSVLMGTESFWEGVDVPGDALEVLLLTKLPFAVPTEPIVEAQMEVFSRRGLDPFRCFSLPEAVLKFRQGFGRLIRNREDRGVVIICDTRVLTASYGHLFLHSLPTKALICSDKETLLNEIQQWL